jgi:hypothetical protein
MGMAVKADDMNRGLFIQGELSSQVCKFLYQHDIKSPSFMKR